MNLTLEQYERIQPGEIIERGGKRMAFVTPNLATKWRVDTVLTKEPCTIERIESFEAGDILVDVGANVGMYSIWAASMREARVFAFEPESQNYAILNRNIALNGLQNLIRAYCVGLLDKQGLTQLFMANLQAGGSCHSLGESLDYKHEPLKAVFVQGSVGFTLDGMVSSGALPIPNYIKIDVDGFEPKVISGSMQTLTNKTVRSLLIEINLNLPDHQEIVSTLNDMGFKHDPIQVKAATRKEGAFMGVAEHIFFR